MSQRPPGPSGSWPYYSLFDFRKDALRFLQRTQKTYGDLAYYRLSGQDTYLVSDPDAIEKIFVKDNRNFIKSRGLDRTKPLLGEGLLTSEGDFHRRQRRLVQPAFHRKRIQSYAEVMVKSSLEHQDRWQSGQQVDMSLEMMELTMTIVGHTLFGMDVSKQANAVSHSIDKLLKGWWISLLMPQPVFRAILKLPLKRLQQFTEAIKQLDEVVYSLIRERRASGKDHGDLLSMLLQSIDEEDGGQMTEQQARDEAMTLFVAGHETTANALTWTWYLLSQHPEVEAWLHEELDEVLQGRPPTLDDLPQLPRTEQVLFESMRLYPPAYLIGRQALEDYETLGYTIPGGSTVMISPWAMHRDPRFWEKPEEFYPQHFAPEKRGERHKYVYIPFGGGVRRCIGEAFAIMEGKLLLATLCQQWKARHVEGHLVETQPLITLRPRHGMQMSLEARQKS